MELSEMDRVRPVIERFAGEMFADLPRRDQRGKGELYVRGLLTDGKRKSMVPMAARLGVDHQQLQQFVTSSTWDYRQVRRRLTGWATGFLDPVALVVDDTGFPKDGPASPGVARMYSGTLGKVGNCQIGVSVHAVTDWASAAVDWRLFLPASWDDTALSDPQESAAARARRAHAGVPDEARHREKWRLALDMIDELAGWGMPVRPVVADAGYGDAAEFRQGLTDRNIPYVLAVKPTATAYPADATPVTAPYSGNGRLPVPAYPDPPRDLKSLVMAAGRRAGRYVTWRHGTHKTPDNPTAGMRSRFLALRVRPAGRNITRKSDRSLPDCWLLAEWPPGQPEPTDYWLSTLPTEIPIRDLVRLAKIRWRIEHDYRELKDGLGLDHFEGRTWTGWHHHVTLVSIAQALCTQLRRTPKVPAPA
ncbi:transposase IS4 family protein [Parafrankia sp. EAN1pec]|uniref:IS701 family transposase n=1 Tax=Parafrankia sp. (strain EAN1pec) TaxID=298653 RepID=UPI0000541D98|nr:transposase IS4 family protein [Frankia sp. EAN1pec]